MSRLVVRCGTLFAVLCGVAAAQPPPAVLPAPRPTPPDALDSPLADERARLQEQLKELLKRLSDRPPAPRPATRPEPVRPSPQPTYGPGDLSRAVDGLRAATNYFRDNDTEAALRTFQLLDTTAFTREDRAFVQYMTACCLRKLNRRSEAATLYREVADAKDDEFLAGCAVWQLSLIRSTQELQAQLEQLRPQPKEGESRSKKLNEFRP